MAIAATGTWGRPVDVSTYALLDLLHPMPILVGRRRQQQAEEWKSAWGQARIFVYVDRHGELNLHFMAKKAR
ncbi:hypothetical protein N7533_011997 [Penicillium manginii]|uniref:uncharacterized protein n=1 Tax=Penicillium manginii TaxID=203109 RepID=UPI002547A967|nr:uncharacterized protein N7533_011997 [Penicillium manginii]KAJ5739213.1 hypothetical protein N7533_011997 [Penicillium manginii]